MNIHRLTDLKELTTATAAWSRIDGNVPFRSHTWLATWWACFGENAAAGSLSNAELLALTVHDPATDQVVGIAPWFLERTATGGRAIRWLGSGVVCSDYVNVLCLPGYEEGVAVALAQWLESDACPQWDVLELSAVDENDRVVSRLIEELEQRGASSHARSGPTCWRILLPASWDEYLTRLSKTRRKRTRGIIRDWFESGRAELVTLDNANDLPEWLATFEDLHQRRRQSLGQPGCFATSAFADFLREVTPRLFQQGKFLFTQLRVDGQPVAMDFNLLGETAVYAYQGGVDPDELDCQPGHLITIAQLRQAIEQGVREYDFLQGDEPYKHNWRATPTETMDVRVVPNRTRARIAHVVWASGQQTRGWAKLAIRSAQGARDAALSAIRGLNRSMETT